MTKKTKHYVNNKDFHAAIVDYQKICAQHKRKKLSPPIIPNYIGVCIDKICRKLALRQNFIRYTFNEEMVEDGILHCIAAVDNFKTKYTNPFAYFTSIAWNAFIRRIDEETGQNYRKHKNLEDMFIISDEFYAVLGVNNGRSTSDNEGLNRHYEVIRKFEDKLARKKEKTRQAGLQKKKPITSKKVTSKE